MGLQFQESPFLPTERDFKTVSKVIIIYIVNRAFTIQTFGFIITTKRDISVLRVSEKLCFNYTNVSKEDGNEENMYTQNRFNNN